MLAKQKVGKFQDNNNSFKAKNPIISTLSSSVASILTQFMCAPLGVIGVRQQKAYRQSLNNQQQLKQQMGQNMTNHQNNINSYQIDQNSIIKTFKQIYINEGYKTFFNGIRYAVFSTILGSVTMFLTYEKALEYFNKKFTKVQASFLASGMASLINTTVCFPLEYWKTLSQAQQGRSKKHNFQLGQNIYSAYSITLQRNIILMSSWFPVLELCRDFYRKHVSNKNTYGNIIANNFISGFLAGVVSSAVTQPFDICKNRKQIFEDFKNYEKGSLRIIYRLYEQEGIRAFLPGFRTRMIGVSFYGSILFSLYETGSKIIQENQQINNFIAIINDKQ